MAIAVEKLPQARDMAPDFFQSSTAGRQYQLSSFRGRRDLVIMFVGDGADSSATRLLTALARQQDELEFEETQVLVVFRGKAAAAAAFEQRHDLPFPILIDADASVHARYGADPTALVVTDRYGEIYAVYRAELPPIDDLIASLRHINAACPE